MGLKLQPNPIPIGEEASVPAGANGELEFAPGRALAVPARLRPLGRVESSSVREASQTGLLDAREVEEMDDGRYLFTAEISSMALDAYYTHMADSTLRNFARDAADGVSLLDSHDGYKLGVGYSAGGRYEEENGEGRALGVFYIAPGIHFGGRHSFASTDDYIRAVESGVVRDVSVGFYGGRWVCDLCRQPYFGQGSTCNHIAGWEYEIERDGRMEREVCTVTIHDARLSEVSLVYDGATPGAMIQKAEQEAEAGRLSPAMARQIERQYRIQLPQGRQSIVAGATGEVQDSVATSASAATTIEISNMEVDGERAMEEEIIETVEAEGIETPQVDEETEELRSALAEIRQAVSESAAPQGITLAEAVRGLNEQLAAAVQARDEALAEVARLQPLADQGRAWREELVNQAVAEGVRAMGAAFPEETYRAMLVNAPLEHIRQVRDTFAEQAAARFPGGRQTRDANEESKQPERPATPAAAYGAQ